MATTGDKNYIGPYRLLKRVRSGHTCSIWEAMNSTDNRRVALKSLQKEYRSDKEEIAFLKNEFAVGKLLSHPNIISVFEFNIDRGIPYVVMEYFETLNLKQALQEKSDYVQKHLHEIILGAAEALAYLHGQGFVHRDVKPDNFLIDLEDHIKLIDFAIAQRIKKGIAKLLVGKPIIQGTRSYMSPEQIRGEALDGRADLYSFGCMLFEMIGGKKPYTGSSADELLTKHLRAGVPSLRSVNNIVTKEFSDLVARSMAKKRDDRPANMEEFLADFKKTRIFRIRKPVSG